MDGWIWDTNLNNLMIVRCVGFIHRLHEGPSVFVSFKSFQH